MLPDTEQLQRALQQYRHWRDLGNILLLVGALIETVIDTFWPEPAHPPLLRGRKATGLIRGRTERGKRPAVFFVGLVVFVGISIEWIAGTMADDKADEIRTNLETKLIEVMPRPSLLYGENRKRLVAALKNSKFADQKVETRYCEIYFSRQYIDNDTIDTAMLLPFIMRQAGWKADLPNRQNDCNGQGIWIQLASNASVHTRNAAAALTKALKNVPLVADQTADLSPPEEPPSDINTIVVTVEAHPF